MTQLAFLFGSVRDDRALDLAALLDALPRLTRGALEDCSLGVRASADLFVCVARLREPVSPATIARLGFWAWRVGGSVRREPELAPADGGAAAEAPLRCCSTIVRAVTPGLLATAGRTLLARLPGVTSHLAPGPLSLRLQIGTPRDDGLVFERCRGVLFVPSPCAPPVLDELVLDLRMPGDVGVEGRPVHLPGSTVLRADGVVTAHRAAGEDGPGSPAGFLLGLVSPAPEVVAALDAHAGPRSAPTRRRAPRYPVRARARISAVPGERRDPPEVTALLTYASTQDLADDYLENLSQGGAFVRTAEPLPVGASVHLEMELPDGTCAAAAGTVAYRNERGVGIEFRLDAEGEAAIADALALVASQRRRALVVDDDRLARRMLGDALASSGYEVFAAEDGAAGLRVITDELLGLDLLVTDVHMPGLGGEQLVEFIRGLGGERDLAIVVVTGDCDRDLERRLLGAGADRVLGKEDGPAAIADAAQRAVLARRRGAAPERTLAAAAGPVASAAGT